MSTSVERVLILVCLCSIITGYATKTKFDPGKTNALVIIGDDAGLQMSCYGNRDIKSPNFDKLAARSLVFKHGFTSVSSCSPSRSVILTGIPQHQNGMYGLHHNPHHFNSFDDVRSLPVILGEHSIRTGIVGKKHVGPDDVYKFDYEQTEENNSLNQVGRNITFMKLKIKEFLSNNDTRPFLLYIGFHDPHRCGVVGQNKLGEFCENFGDGRPGNGVIPDWKPILYDPASLEVPYFIPNTATARQDLANMYKTLSRMDQGIGLFMKELSDAGFMDNTMILYSSDNGIPFPNSKTNLYESGMMEPFMVSSPVHKQSWGQQTEALASTMDITPTVLDWFDINYHNSSGRVRLTGKSLWQAVDNPDTQEYTTVYSSHNFHEVTMYYPMRVIRTKQYRLIHNLNYHAPYAIASDLFGASTYQDLLNRSASGQPTYWFKTLDQYYHRKEWELFDLVADPYELTNLAYNSTYQPVLNDLRNKLMSWITETQDPWYCLPGGDVFKGHCANLENGEVFNPLKESDETNLRFGTNFKLKYTAGN